MREPRTAQSTDRLWGLKWTSKMTRLNDRSKVGKKIKKTFLRGGKWLFLGFVGPICTWHPWLECDTDLRAAKWTLINPESGQLSDWVSVDLMNVPFEGHTGHSRNKTPIVTNFTTIDTITISWILLSTLYCSESGLSGYGQSKRWPMHPCSPHLNFYSISFSN